MISTCKNPDAKNPLYRVFLCLGLFPIWGDDAGKAGKLLFTRKEVFPLSPRPSLPFKKSGKTFLFTFTYLCREQSLVFYACSNRR